MDKDTEREERRLERERGGEREREEQERQREQQERRREQQERQEERQREEQQKQRDENEKQGNHEIEMERMRREADSASQNSRNANVRATAKRPKLPAFEDGKDDVDQLSKPIRKNRGCEPVAT